VNLLFWARAPAAAPPTPAPQKIERGGVTVEFEPAASAVEGEDVLLSFAIRAADGTPLKGIRPAAWIDERNAKTACRDKVQSFLGGTLSARPQVDLNTYYVLTLNAEASVAVIDPLIGFGGSKLLTAVTLESPGVDWVLSADQKRLFVAMPLVNRVAVIDTETWRVVKNVATGVRPSRLALQERLWVASDEGVTVIDPRTLQIVKTIATGQAPHAFAFAPGVAFVTNGRDGTVSVIDTATLAKRGDVATGKSADGLAYSTLGNALYVIDGIDGTISVIDPAEAKVTKRIAAKPGLNSIQFAPGGRWGFATNGRENVVSIVDSSTASIAMTARDVGAGPDQVAFTDDFAYVRASGADQVKMIRLADLGRDKEPNFASFTGGQIPPGAARTVSFAAAIVAAPEPKAVLVANPADRLVYFYNEGMAAPMGSFSAQRRSPKAVLVLDRSLRESAPNVFTIRTRVAEAGTYDVAFFLNEPRVVHCFELAVAANPKAPRRLERTVKIEPLLDRAPIHAGGVIDVKFRLSDGSTSELHRNVRDVRALTFLAPGIRQQRIAATPDAEGLYHVQVPVPESGVYYVFLESPSLNLRINEGRPLIFEAVAKGER
jgi:YVTN family beta-propeller protein